MGKIDTKVFSLSIPGAPNVEVSCELTDRVGSTYQSLTISSGGANSQEFKLITAVDDKDLNAGSVQFQLDLTIPDKRGRFVEKGFCGLKFEPGIELSGVRIAVRSADRPSEYTAEHPFFSLYLDWTVTATAAAGTKWSNGGAAGGAQLRLPLTTGFACIRPPTLPNIGLPDLECRLDLSGIVVTTGWRPLALPNLNISLPQIGSWFGWLAGLNLTVPLPSWDVSLQLIPTLPLGVGFKTTDLTLEQTGSGHRLKATAKTLQIAWRGATVLEYEDFEASLTYDGAQYVLNVQLVEAHYPSDGVSTTPDKLTVPAGALTIECACWRFRFGVFADNAGGSTNLCPELLIEMGGLAMGSRWATKPLWQAQALRLHLRGTSVLTCKATAGTLFDGVAGSAFAAYRLPLTGHGLSELWPEVGTPPPEDPKIEFVDGSFDKDGLITLLWKQDNDRILHALLKAVPWIDKQQVEPPPGGKMLVALQFARFGKDRQLRLEWRPDTQIAVGGGAAPQPPAGGEVCASLNGTEIVLLIPPATSGGAASGPIVDRDFSLSLPGVNVALAQPQVRSLVFYGGEDKWSVSLLHAYDAAPRTIASASFNAMRFLTAGPSEDAAQDALPAMPGDGAKPFAAMNLASDGSRWQVLSMLSWTDGELPRVLQALEGSGAAFEPLYPNNVGVVVGDCAGCPVEAAKPQPIPLCLSTTRFASPRLNEAEGWRFDMAVQAANDLFRDKGSTIGPVNIGIDKVCRPSDANAFDLYAKLKVDVLNNKVEGSAVLRLDLSDMSVRLRDKAAFDIRRDVSTVTDADHLAAFKLDKELHVDVSEPIELLKLKIYLVRTLPKKNGPVPAAASLPFLRLTLEGGRYLVELNEGKLEGEVYQAFVVSDEALGLLCFEVAKFRVGSGGLDLTAKLLPTQVKVSTLKEPFLLNDASLEIVGNRMRHLSIGATGKLPELLSSAPIRLTIGLKQVDTGIVLDELVCELADKDKPIVTTGLRFRFEISQLELRYRRTEAGDKLFFFEVSGKAQFEPDLGEFDGKLLENLKTATIEFNRAPLSDEFIEHVEFSVELREPVVFEVFKVFRMEIRSLGFHPKYDFSGSRDPKRMRPALIVGGQCMFADAGDVISAEIDFHKLYIGMPAAESAVPQVDFKDLRVEVQAAGGFRLGGSVVSIDEPKRKGFKGDGVIAIPGLPELGAAVGFMQLQRSDGAWVRAWFIAIEASKISYQIPPLPIYLRQIGAGLGVRMFPVIMRGVDEDQPLTKVIERMSANIDAHITLARQESWFDQVEEPGERALWVVALEAAFTLGTTQGQGAKYDEEAEKGLRTIVVQLLGALRSDLTIVTAMKAWLPISVDDYFNDRENMHQRPLVKGFMLYSPRQQRLLAYGTKGKDVYYGPKGDKIAEFYKLILDPMPFEFVALIEPNRVRGEMGWVDRLVFSLDIGLLKIECRGGILFAIEQRMIVHGIYFAARGRLGLRGGAGGGSLGLRLVAEADVNFATRLLVGQHMLLPLPAGIYGQVGISVNVVLMIQAWLHIDFRFFSIDIDLEFSLTIQILLSLEMGLAGGTDIGFKGYATVGISIFGRTLSARIAVGLNEGAVGNARDLMQSFLSSVLEPGKVPPVPGETAAPGPVIAAAPGAVNALAPGAAVAATPAADATPGAEAPLAPPPLETNAPPDQGGVLELPVAVTVSEPNKEPFAFSVVEAGTAGGVKRWVIWIVPTPKDGVFYPVPAEGKAEYAKLTGLAAQGATIKVFAEDGTLVPVTDEETTIVVDSDRRFKSKDAPASVKLSLRTLMAGSYAADDAGSGFPFDIGAVLPPLHGVDASTSKRTVLTDDRVVLGPRHVDPDFNPNHPYDRALNEDAPNADTSPRALALGNQAFLMQWMHDGVQRLAAVLAAGDQPGPRGPDAATGLADLGMVLVIEGELPDWATKRDSTTTRPSIRFVSEQGFAVEHTVHECSLQPLVAPDRIRFSNGGIRLLSDPIAHFDEDLLSLAWDIGWTEEIAAADVAPGIGTKVKDFLRHYRVEIFDLGGVADKPLLVRDVLPLSRETETHSLQTPYSLTVSTAELFPPQLRNGGVRRQVLVTVTPVSQAGDEGRTFTITAQLRPRLTPLPPENAELELSFVREAGNLRPVASLTWSQPPIPNKPGIAFPEDWEIVVRHLPQVPIGHYPQATVAVGESEGRMSSDRTCRPGDLIMRVGRGAAQGLLKKIHGPDGRELFKLLLPDNNVTWVDYLGEAIDPNSALGKLRSAFQGQATETGWQFFIRSRSVTRYADGSSDATYSSMSAVRLHAQLKSNQLAGAPQQSEAQSSSDKDRITVGHLEWPRVPEPLVEIAGVPNPRRPEAVMGPLHVPLLKSGTGDRVIQYVNGGDARRAVTVSWSGFAEATAPLARLAGFRILEAQDETLLNADLDGALKSPDFEPVWTEITRFDAADREIAGRSPSTLADTKNWQAWPPALAEKLGHVSTAKAPTSQIQTEVPGLPLVWPPELLRSDFPALKDLQSAASPSTGDKVPLADGWRIAGRRLHAALDWFLGYLDVAVGKKGWVLTAATGKPLTSGVSVADWMDSNTAVDDPQGWAALWQLGLGVELSARDASTGLAIGQTRLLKEVEAVFESLKGGAHDPAWMKIRDHLSLDLPIQAAEALLAESKERPLAEIGLDRLQVSLRPTAQGDWTSALPESLEARIGAVDWPWHEVGDEKTVAMSQEQKAKATERYEHWARRFVGLAPTGTPSEGVFDVKNTTTVAPLAATIETLCADGVGKYRFTREVKQQWALSRLVRVAVEQRYDRLIEAMSSESISATDDWSFERVGGYIGNRVRRLEPPQLLGERLIKQDDGQVFHEVVFSRHAEAALSAANIPAGRRLEFLGTERRYQRVFYDIPWVDKLNVVPGPVLSTPPIGEIDDDWSPAFPKDDEFIEAVPSARFGALSFLTPTEAFFYDTKLDVRSRAVACKSEIVNIPLHRKSASKTIPSSDPGLSVARKHGGIWQGEPGALYEQWKNALSADDPVLELLTCCDYRIETRFPRYFESLNGVELGRERVQNTVAMLPDGGATLQFSLGRVGMEETFAAVRTERGSQADVGPFVLIQTGPEVGTYELTYEKQAWSEGMRIGFRARLDSASVVVQATKGRPMASQVPCELNAWKPGSLPSVAPLARAAPLALRLATDVTGMVRLFNPFPVALDIARPLTRAHSVFDPEVLASAKDLSLGIRLLLDPERMAAAVAFGVGGGAPIELADAIETAPAVALRRIVALIDPVLWQQMLAGLRIWGLTDAPDAMWTRCAPDAEVPAVQTKIIVAADEGSADWQEVLKTFLAVVGDDGDPDRARSVDELKELILIAEQLADTLLAPLDEVRITAWVQRENEARTQWGNKHG